MTDEETTTTERGDGFEYDGTFYRWHVTDGGKDLMLIDRFARMPVTDFFEIIEQEDGVDSGRAPILLALIATSIRDRHPDWTVERIERTVLNLNLGDVSFLGGDTEEGTLPPSTAGTTPATAEPSDSHADAQ